MGEGAILERPHQPAHDLHAGEGIGRQIERQADACTGGGAYRDPCENERQRAFRLPRQQQKRGESDQGAGYGEQRQQCWLCLRQAEIEGDHGAQRSGVGGAQDRRLSERIAQIALQHCAREAQHRTDQQAEQGTRQAQIEQDVAQQRIARAGDDSRKLAWPIAGRTGQQRSGRQ